MLGERACFWNFESFVLGVVLLRRYTFNATFIMRSV